MYSYLEFALILAAGAVGGFLLEKFVFVEIHALARRTRWELDDVILNSLRGLITFLGLVIAFYFSYHLVPFLVRYESMVHKGLLAVVILLATIAGVRFAGELVRFYTKKQAALPSTTIFVNLTKGAVFVIGMLVMLQTLGIAITPIITTLGIGGIAVALALQDTLSNLFSGLQILAARQLKPGDFVKLDTGEMGYVQDVTWRNTSIRDLSNNIIIVPNARLGNAIVVNYNLPANTFKVKIPVGVAYSTDLEKAEKIAIEVADSVVRQVEGKEPPDAPFVRYSEFGDSSINFTVIISINEFENQYLVRHEFIKQLHRRFMEEGIEIPFPIRTVYLHQSD